jgi:hypothetical protein
MHSHNLMPPLNEKFDVSTLSEGQLFTHEIISDGRKSIELLQQFKNKRVTDVRLSDKAHCLLSSHGHQRLKSIVGVRRFSIYE